MFEQRIVELMKTENRKTCDEFEQVHSNMRPVHFKPSLMDRVLPILGEAMIIIGFKLKNRSHMKLNTEQAHSPNFMIML
jgi:hypothetical protein